MRIKCINNIGNWEDTVRLTVGKTYNVEEIREDGYLIQNDIGTLACYYKYRFEEVKEVEKEKVLEVEFQDVFDKVAWRITYQNTDVLQRNKFEDKELGVRSCLEPNNDRECLFLRGDLIEEDSKVCIATKKEAEIIKHKLDAVNEKYGIPKRWRAKKGEKYWFISGHSFNILETIDNYGKLDKTQYELGNYFKTKEDAQVKLDKIKQIFAE